MRAGIASLSGFTKRTRVRVAIASVGGLQNEPACRDNVRMGGGSVSQNEPAADKTKSSGASVYKTNPPAGRHCVRRRFTKRTRLSRTNIRWAVGLVRKTTRGRQKEIDRSVCFTKRNARGWRWVFGFTKRTRQCVCPGSMLGRSGICPTGVGRTCKTNSRALGHCVRQQFYKTNPPAVNKLALAGNLGRRSFLFSTSVCFSRTFHFQSTYTRDADKSFWKLLILNGKIVVIPILSVN
jgi:hypothetical protein